MGKNKGCCGDGSCDDHDDHDHASVNPGNPFANLDEETRMQIQELQMLEQNFQQLLMQKNAFSMESNETDFVIKEVEKTSGEVSRIVGNQVVIKATKEEVLKDMKDKKKLIELRMKSIDEQEKVFSRKIEEIRDEVMKKIQG
ncbi:MAG: prefoldin subunit [archaeon]|nr:prefoldin subunit [archaeon]MCR4324006.1 prefoldin subunit [Nanoarchaeota archaeon]